MNFAVFVTGRMISAIPALWFVGWLLKRMKRVSNSLIPFILAALGVIAGLLVDGLPLGYLAPANLRILMDSTGDRAAAVMGHQAVKQGSEIVKGNADENENTGRAA